jgi:hypothetical protein
MAQCLVDKHKKFELKSSYMCVLQHVFVAGEIGRHTAIDEYVLDAIAGRGASVVQRVDLVAQRTASLKENKTRRTKVQ